MSTSQYSITVRFDEVDAMGIVWHGNYLKYFEAARFNHIEHLNGNGDNLLDSMVFVVKEMSVNYTRPARFKNVLIVYTSINEVKKCHIKFKQKIVCEDKMICEAATTFVSIDNDGEISFIPRDIVSTIKSISLRGE